MTHETEHLENKVVLGGKNNFSTHALCHGCWVEIAGVYWMHAGTQFSLSYQNFRGIPLPNGLFTHFAFISPSIGQPTIFLKNMLIKTARYFLYLSLKYSPPFDLIKWCVLAQ